MAVAAARGRGQRAPKPPKAKTVQWRNWRSVNQTDARTAIDDDDLYWMENAITVGKGAIQILNAQGSSVATIAAGIASMWGVTLNNSPVLITINSDGSISQVSPGGVVTAVAPAASVTTAAHVTMWRGSPVLIIDPTAGYSSWDGATYTVIDATRTGTAIASFEGRVWIANGRTITYTAPNTYNDFTPGNGAGSTILTDEAFPGNIVNLVSAVEQLWIFGAGAVDALSNVSASGTAPSVITTFSITNVVTNLGTTAHASCIGYFRALAFMSPFGVYALSGVTPQKLSEKLDGLFDTLTLGNSPAAIATVRNLPCLLFLVTYTGSLAQAGSAPLPMLLGFTQGKWFFAFQGTSLTWITTLIVNGVSQAWGTDGASGHIYQLFGAASDQDVTYKVQSKHYDFGLATTAKASMKVGVEFQATQAVAPTLTVDSEYTSQALSLSAGNELTLQNAVGGTLTLVNALSAPLTIVTQGQVLDRRDAAMYGHYLGWTISGTDPPFRIQAVQMEIIPTREWSHP